MYGYIGKKFIKWSLVLVCWAGLTGHGPVVAAAEADKPPAQQQGSFYDRIMDILKTPPKIEFPQPPQPTPPVTAEKRETSIFGAPEVTKEQMVNYIRRHNPIPKLNCSLEDLASFYYEEAAHEGIRPDLALAQAILETGFFRYGGDVLPEQNNYAGIGTTGRGVRGEWFTTPQLGVRAHVQHLLVYSSTKEPAQPLVDPRYHLVRQLPAYHAQCPTWESLSGKWAVPGVDYGNRILRVLENVKKQITG